MYELGRDKGSEKQFKICGDLKFRIKYLIEDYFMFFILVLELVFGGELIKIQIRFLKVGQKDRLLQGNLGFKKVGF